MRRIRIIVVAALLAASLGLSGCKRKKPPVPPPQAQAPTLNIPEIEPLPPPEPAEAQPAEEPAEPATKPTPEVTKPKSRKLTKKKPANKLPSHIIVENGGKDPNTPPPPLVADNSQDAAARQKKTEELLADAERRVNSLPQSVSASDTAMVQHVRSFVDQSRQAIKEGDIDRAYNLAVKAHLLTDSLKK